MGKLSDTRVQSPDQEGRLTWVALTYHAGQHNKKKIRKIGYYWGHKPSTLLNIQASR